MPITPEDEIENFYVTFFLFHGRKNPLIKRAHHMHTMHNWIEWSVEAYSTEVY